MDRINALGKDTDRHLAYSKELLTETNDKELQLIVKKAAKELSSPMAIVSLVLDHIQFFKASVGLPDSLLKSKSTHRDASFCQFVVRDQKPFEVNDAPNDTRVPQQVVKDFNIKAYLGVPIKVNEIIIGSLCVLDTKEREFTEDENNSLIKLSGLVNDRLEKTTEKRRKIRLNLNERALKPGLYQLGASLAPVQANINSSYSSVASIRSFLIMAQTLIEENPDLSNTYKSSLQAAIKANEESEGYISEIEASMLDIEDGVNALGNLTSLNKSMKLSEILIASQDLSLHLTKEVGGFRLPDVGKDPIIYPNGMLAIAILSNCLISLAEILKKEDYSGGITIKVIEHEAMTTLHIYAKAINTDNLKAISAALKKYLDEDPSVNIQLAENSIVLSFRSGANDSN